MASDIIINSTLDGPRRLVGGPRFPAIVWFRAVAIMLIVAGHSYDLAEVKLVTFVDDAVSDLIRGATALFVFLSGFVFEYVVSARYSYGRFLLDRARKLLIPYLVLTTLAGFLFLNWANGGPSFYQLLRQVFLGDTFQAYWYVPFIMLMFTLAPLHRLFMQLAPAHQVGIIICAAILGGIVQRPVGNDNAFQSVVFYLPIYLVGIFVSLHRETLIPALKKFWPTLLLLTMLLAVIQAATGQGSNWHKPFFEIDGFEVMGIQKLVLSAALIGLFAKCSSPPGHIVRVVADTSFATFVLHPFVIRFVKRAEITLFERTDFAWINLATVTIVIVAICAMAALALRALLGRFSKYLCGY